MRRIAAIVLLAASIAGCAGSGSINWNNARMLRDGMSIKEVTDLMGQPYRIQTVGKGEVKYIWVHVNPLTGSESAHMTFKDGKLVQAPEVPASF
jgi:hypothetical protein